MTDPEAMRTKYRRFLALHPEYKDAILPIRLPFDRFKVYQLWKPRRIKVLVIAESPPWNDTVYFYNENREGGLGQTIFQLLRIEGDSKREQLEEFRRRNYFLIDTVKCVFKKNAKRSIPKALIKYSAQEILQEEIANLHPQCILILGSTALTALKTIPKFSTALSKYESITQANGKSILLYKTLLVMSVYPNDRNKQYWTAVEATFRKISK